MEKLKEALYYKLKEKYPNQDKIIIPIKNKNQYIELMSLFDTLDIRWANFDNASNLVDIKFINSQNLITYIILNRCDYAERSKASVMLYLTFTRDTSYAKTMDSIPFQDIITLIDSFIHTGMNNDYISLQLPILNNMNEGKSKYEKKIDFLNKLKRVYPEPDTLLIPIASEYQYNELMKSFADIDLRWSNGMIANRVSYRTKYIKEPRLDFVGIRIRARFPYSTNINRYFTINQGFGIHYHIPSGEQIHNRKQLVNSRTLIDLIEGKEYEDVYKEPQLPNL